MAGYSYTPAVAALTRPFAVQPNAAATQRACHGTLAPRAKLDAAVLNHTLSITMAFGNLSLAATPRCCSNLHPSVRHRASRRSAHPNRRCQSPSRRNRRLNCCSSFRCLVPRATRSLTPGLSTASNPRLGSFRRLNVMVLVTYSKSFFGWVTIRNHPYSAWWICNARATAARSRRAGPATSPALVNSSATSHFVPAPSSTTRCPCGPNRRRASRASAR